MHNKINKTPASTIETIDTGLFNWVENLNLYTNSNQGFTAAPVLWLGTERVYQIKSDQRIRDKVGKLILPLITINRSSMVKDPSFKGSFQAHYPEGAEGGSTIKKKNLNQEKTSNFQTSKHFVDSKGNQIGKHIENNSVVHDYYTSPIPVYVTMMYDIVIRTEYQQQMNDLVQPFITKTGQVGAFLFKRDGHSFEAFVQQDFGQTDTVSSLGEQGRIFETKISIKVLGYLMGEGINRPKPKLSRKENRAKIRFTRERSIVGDKIPWKDKDSDYRD